MSRYSQIWLAFEVSALRHQAGAVVACYDDGGWT